jgi:integrase
MTEQQERPEKKTRKPKSRGHGEGSIYERKGDTIKRNKPWVAQIPLENGKKKLLYFKTRQEAQLALRKALNEQEQGMLVTEKDQTVKQYMEYWLEHVHKPAIRLSTYVKCCELVRLYILPALGHIKLQRLTIQQVQILYSQLQEKQLSASRIRFIHVTLHKALDDAVHTGLVSKNVCDSVKPPRLVRKERPVLTPEQAQQLLEAAKGSPMEALLTVALATGMRRGELLGLKWRDINLEKCSLQVARSMDRVAGHGVVESEPKTAQGRRGIALPPFAVEALKQHHLHQLEARLKAGPRWNENDLVFCNVYGNFLHPFRLYTMFHKVLADAGLPHMHFHDLRHSAATILLAMGINIKVVQEILGHSQVSMTLGIYSHVLPGMQEEAMGRMNDLFRKRSDDEEAR